MSEPETLREIIARKGVGTPPRKKMKLELLRSSWAGIVGETLAEHSGPTRISRGTLTVAAESAAWASELSMKSAELARRVAEVLGKGSVKKVRVETRTPTGEPAATPGKTPGGADEKAVEDQKIDGRVKESLGSVEDDSLRDALARLVRASSKASEQSRQDQG